MIAKLYVTQRFFDEELSNLPHRDFYIGIPVIVSKWVDDPPGIMGEYRDGTLFIVKVVEKESEEE